MFRLTHEGGQTSKVDVCQGCVNEYGIKVEPLVRDVMDPDLADDPLCGICNKVLSIVKEKQLFEREYELKEIADLMNNIESGEILAQLPELFPYFEATLFAINQYFDEGAIDSGRVHQYLQREIERAEQVA